jgi:hypothetical protein
MTDDAERLAEDVTGTMAGLPTLSDMDDDETVTRKVNWYDHPRHEDTAGWSLGAVFGIDSDKWTEYVEEHFGPKVDRRRLKSGTTTHVGHLVVRGDGEIVGHEVRPDVLKPSEQGDA